MVSECGHVYEQDDESEGCADGPGWPRDLFCGLVRFCLDVSAQQRCWNSLVCIDLSESEWIQFG